MTTRDALFLQSFQFLWFITVFAICHERITFCQDVFVPILNVSFPLARKGTFELLGFTVSPSFVFQCLGKTQETHHVHIR